jgi:hypothetical protein
MRLSRGPAPPPEVIATTKKQIEGVKTHRCNTIDRRDGTEYRGIPCSPVPRTLIDLAAVLSSDDLARAFHDARVTYGTEPKHVEAVLARRPNAKGATELRRVLRGDTKISLSKLEQRFLKLRPILST